MTALTSLAHHNRDKILIWTNKDLVVTSDHQAFDLDVIHGFLRTAYWSEGIDRETVARAVANSMGFALFASGDQIGFARVITDYARFAFLCDVFVLPEWRAAGRATWMLKCVFSHPAIRDLSWQLGTKDAHKLYEKFGFRSHHDPTRLMVRPRPERPHGGPEAMTP